MLLFLVRCLRAVLLLVLMCTHTLADYSAILGFIIPPIGLLCALIAMCCAPEESRRRRAGLLGLFTAVLGTSAAYVLILYFTDWF